MSDVRGLKKAINERISKIQVRKLTVSFKVGERAALGAVLGPTIIDRITREVLKEIQLQASFRQPQKQK